VMVRYRVNTLYSRESHPQPTVSRGLEPTRPGPRLRNDTAGDERHLGCDPALARASGRDFLPLREERYDRVIPLEFLNASAAQAMLDAAVRRPF
jgi:hypothetical protein